MPDLDNLVPERTLFRVPGWFSMPPHEQPRHNFLGPIVYRCKVVDLAALTAQAENFISVFDTGIQMLESTGGVFLLTGAFMIVNYVNSGGTTIDVSLGTAGGTVDNIIRRVAVAPRAALNEYSVAGLHQGAHNNPGNVLFNTEGAPGGMRAAAAYFGDMDPATSLPNGFRKLPSFDIQVRVSGGVGEPQQGKIRPYILGIPFNLDD